MPIIPMPATPRAIEPRVPPFGRRRLIGALAVGGAVAAAAPYRAFAAPLKPRPAEYLVFIDGKRSGTYTTEFVPRKNGFTATTSMSIRVDVLFITAYDTDPGVRNPGFSSPPGLLADTKFREGFAVLHLEQHFGRAADDGEIVELEKIKIR